MPRVRWVRVTAGAALVFLTAGASASAQATASAGDRIELQLGIEARRDRIEYHFDNPSSFDTPFLVPHFFEQRYFADNRWIVATARYTAGIRWETSAGVTPVRDARGDDYDTFFDPDGTVWVSGTTGGVSIRSFRVSERGEVARVAGVRLLVGYRFRLDRADFQLGHKTIARNGSVASAFDVTGPETVSSQVHEPLVALSKTTTIATVWQLMGEAEIAPGSLGRLVVRLPEKYPGQDLVFAARVGAVGGRVSIARRARWPVELSVDVGRTWSYRATARLKRDLLGARVMIGRAW
jgi:hypothetical protein